MQRTVFSACATGIAGLQKMIICNHETMANPDASYRGFECYFGDLNTLVKNPQIFETDRKSPVKLVAIRNDDEFVIDNDHRSIFKDIITLCENNSIVNFLDLCDARVRRYYMSQSEIDDLNFNRHFADFQHAIIHKRILDTEKVLCMINDGKKFPHILSIIAQNKDAIKRVVEVVFDEKLSENDPIITQLTPVVNALDDDEINEIFRKCTLS
jgi:hypothetical protein